MSWVGAVDSRASSNSTDALARGFRTRAHLLPMLFIAGGLIPPKRRPVS